MNAIRKMPNIGTVVWGARPLGGVRQRAGDLKYAPVKRAALFIEETLRRALTWVVFEPNEETPWTHMRGSIDGFMHNLFGQGALAGSRQSEAFFVKCGPATTPQADIDRGIINIMVGFAPIKPSEFVIIPVQQIVGQNRI